MLLACLPREEKKLRLKHLASLWIATLRNGVGKKKIFPTTGGSQSGETTVSSLAYRGTPKAKKVLVEGRRQRVRRIVEITDAIADLPVVDV